MKVRIDDRKIQIFHGADGGWGLATRLSLRHAAVHAGRPTDAPRDHAVQRDVFNDLELSQSSLRVPGPQAADLAIR